MAHSWRRVQPAANFSGGMARSSLEARMPVPRRWLWTDESSMTGVAVVVDGRVEVFLCSLGLEGKPLFIREDGM